jgi:hypothetical protein
LFVLRELRLETDQLLEEARKTLRGLATLPQHSTEPVRTRDEPMPRAIHRDVAVALEQAHETAHLIENFSLAFRRDQRHHTAIGQWVAPGAEGLRRTPDCVEEAFGVGVYRIEHLLDQTEEVLSHPWDARELRAVGHLVECQPQPGSCGASSSMISKSY